MIVLLNCFAIDTRDICSHLTIQQYISVEFKEPDVQFSILIRVLCTEYGHEAD
jgi:hypothetical protein